MASTQSPYSYPCSPDIDTNYPSSPSGSSHSSTDSSLAYNCLPEFESYIQIPPYSDIGDPASTTTRNPRSRNSSATGRADVSHPYARLYKKEEVKRRKIWNHALEKSLFSPYEISTIGAPQRRKIYISSLEAHIDKLHAQLLAMGFWPVAFDELEPYRGLNSKTAKSAVSGLQHDASVAKLKLLELERANQGLKLALQNAPFLEDFSALHPPVHYNYSQS